jgi:glucokinase
MHPLATSSEPVFVGIDIGGTKTLALAATSDGRILGRAVNPTPAQRPVDAVMDVIMATTGAAVSAAGVLPSAVRAAAIASAGAVSPDRGMVVWAPQIPAFSDTPVVDLFRSHWDLPTVIGNDANLAALGEQRFGAGEGVPDLLFITVSTGIGGGIIIGGKLYTGSTGFAGEIGHMTVEAHGPLGRSTTPGAWESLCGGTALVRIAEERMEAGEATTMNDSITAVNIFAAKRAGDALAGSIVDDAIGYLAAGLTSLVNIFNPGKIIIGGGLSNEWDAYISPAVKIMRGQTFANAGRDLPVVPPLLGADAGALGAVALAHDLTEE